MPKAARDLVDSGKEKLYAGKNPQKALSDFESAVAKAPGYYEAYYQIGNDLSLFCAIPPKPKKISRNPSTSATRLSEMRSWRLLSSGLASAIRPVENLSSAKDWN